MRYMKEFGAGLRAAKFMIFARWTSTGPANPMRIDSVNATDISHEGLWFFG